MDAGSGASADGSSAISPRRARSNRQPTALVPKRLAVGSLARPGSNPVRAWTGVDWRALCLGSSVGSSGAGQ